MPFTVVGVLLFPSQQMKLIMAQVSRGKAGRGRSLTGLRVTEVNILQVRVCHTFEHIDVLSHEIFYN